jgi:hypothetical protein
MKRSVGTFASFTLALVACAAIHGHTAAHAAASSEASNTEWIGVWQATLYGLPSVELTLADDAGDVEGTIVFHRIMKDADGPRVASTEPHTLMHAHVDGNTLAFQVKRGNGSAEILNMAVKLTTSGNAEFRCSNCSATGTEAELTKAQ